jgi:hypothetical protein
LRRMQSETHRVSEYLNRFFSKLHKRFFSWFAGYDYLDSIHTSVILGAHSWFSISADQSEWSLLLMTLTSISDLCDRKIGIIRRKLKTAICLCHIQIFNRKLKQFGEKLELHNSGKMFHVCTYTIPQTNDIFCSREKRCFWTFSYTWKYKRRIWCRCNK